MIDSARIDQTINAIRQAQEKNEVYAQEVLVLGFQDVKERKFIPKQLIIIVNPFVELTADLDSEGNIKEETLRCVCDSGDGLSRYQTRPTPALRKEYVRFLNQAKGDLAWIH